MGVNSLHTGSMIPTFIAVQGKHSASLRCGRSDSRASVAAIYCFGPGYGEHTVEFRLGFTMGEDSVVALSRSTQHQWERWKKERGRWEDFNAKGRRRGGTTYQSWDAPAATFPGQPFRFRCPRCSWLSAVSLTRACASGCALCCSAADSYLP